jgi:hypothetical protein
MVSVSLVVRSLANAREEGAHIVPEGAEESIEPWDMPHYHPLGGLTDLVQACPPVLRVQRAGNLRGANAFAGATFVQ